MARRNDYWGKARLQDTACRVSKEMGAILLRNQNRVVQLEGHWTTGTESRLVMRCTLPPPKQEKTRKSRHQCEHLLRAVLQSSNVLKSRQASKVKLHVGTFSD
jgi:hypothetical protein